MQFSATNLKVNIISSQSALKHALESDQFRIYSCLNGYTLRALVRQGVYDNLIVSQKIAFVVDGVSARRNFSASNLFCDLICGRDLMAAALQFTCRRLICIGGKKLDGVNIEFDLTRYFGRSVEVLVPPIFNDAEELVGFADQVASKLSADALVLIFIRSPLQDLLAGELANRSMGTIFINIGAVLDDILSNRFFSIKIFSAMRLEWMYRLIISPRRTLPKIYAVLTERVNLKKCRYYWNLL